LAGILSPVNMAHMCVAEALSNLVFVKISELADIKCSGNWMWPAKLPGEGYKMYEACLALSKVLRELRIGIDGEKLTHDRLCANRGGNAGVAEM